MTGYPIPPPEGTINQLGYIYLQMGKWDRSAAFFKLNTQLYPKSGNTFDSLGDLYSQQGDHQKAANAYAKALTLSYNADTKRSWKNKKQRSARNPPQFVVPF